MSLRAYARHRGVSIRAVQKAIASKRIRTTPDGKIDPEQADADWGRNTATREQVNLPRRAAPPRFEPEEPASRPDVPKGPDYHRARAIREQFEARLAQIEYETKIGQLLDRSKVEAEAFNLYRRFRDLMLALADRLADILAAEADSKAVHKILDEEIRKALNEFADAATAGSE